MNEEGKQEEKFDFTPDAQSASYQAELGPLQPAAEGPVHALVLRAVDQPDD